MTRKYTRTSHVQPGTQLQGPWLVCVLINHANLCEVTNDLSTGGICNTERPKQCGSTLHNVANGPMLVSSLFLSPSLSHKASFLLQTISSFTLVKRKSSKNKKAKNNNNNNNKKQHTHIHKKLESHEDWAELNGYRN